MLADIAMMRVGLIVLLVITHAFAPYSGSWKLPDNYEGIAAYRHVSLLAHYISMPALIFISGYLFGHSWEKQKSQSFGRFSLKKAKRLLLPSVIFSAIYYICFYDMSAPWHSIACDIANGCGHLWFLPMIFWCFIASYVCGNFNLKTTYVIAGATLLAILPIPALPLRLSSFCSYFIFFYIGFIIKRTGSVKSDIRKTTITSIVIFFAAYLTLYYIIHSSILPPASAFGSGILVKVLYISFENSLLFGLRLTGIAIAYTVSQVVLRFSKNVPELLLTLSTLCYGVYILHQFILKFLYYHTELPGYSPEWLLPWVGFILTTVAALIIAYGLLKTKTGKFLIG